MDGAAYQPIPPELLDPAWLRATLLKYPGFEYFAELPDPAPGEPHGLAWINSQERRDWELQRLHRHAPFYALITAFTMAGLRAEEIMRNPARRLRPLLIEQQRIPRLGDPPVATHKLPTMRRDQPEQVSGRDPDALSGLVADISRNMSFDEYPQFLAILDGTMSFVGIGRLTLRADFELMRQALTPAEFGYWSGFLRDAMFSLHFPGCRSLPAQSPEYLLTRLWAEAFYMLQASRTLDEYYIDVVMRKYFRRQFGREMQNLLRRVGKHS
ncbi:sugar transferase [Nocardia sp. NEAU-G5]|uniref:Sugar transferase n=1 Tax=Nocardia albiluteola TaxID=2842303 RepID=A0ABS6B977_9NOCA|nr:sugar transferase [Nocardia albiluteola]MBU3066847.1 sugar transferase [Nocardia albiluteola]